jgi:cold-inducible RNA-binding protein
MLPRLGRGFLGVFSWSLYRPGAEVRTDRRRSLSQASEWKGPLMAKNIYVGNLAWEATHDDLLSLFQEHGKVKRAQVISDRETGRSRGFGFVEMFDDEEAERAIQALNGAEYNGRPLKVNEALPRENRSGPGTSNGGGNRGSGSGASGDRGRRY